MRCNIDIELVISNIYLLIYKCGDSNFSRDTLIFFCYIFYCYYYIVSIEYCNVENLNLSRDIV